MHRFWIELAPLRDQHVLPAIGLQALHWELAGRNGPFGTEHEAIRVKAALEEELNRLLDHTKTKLIIRSE